MIGCIWEPDPRKSFAPYKCIVRNVSTKSFWKGYILERVSIGKDIIIVIRLVTILYRRITTRKPETRQFASKISKCKCTFSYFILMHIVFWESYLCQTITVIKSILFNLNIFCSPVVLKRNCLQGTHTGKRTRTDRCDRCRYCHTCNRRIAKSLLVDRYKLLGVNLSAKCKIDFCQIGTLCKCLLTYDLTIRGIDRDLRQTGRAECLLSYKFQSLRKRDLIQ